jgi:hypothetical protein
VSLFSRISPTHPKSGNLYGTIAVEVDAEFAKLYPRSASRRCGPVAPRPDVSRLISRTRAGDGPRDWVFTVQAA